MKNVAWQTFIFKWQKKILLPLNSFVFSYYKVKSVVMAKRTCYKLFKNLRKYIHCVPGLVCRQTKNWTQPPLVGGRHVTWRFLVEVSSGKITLLEPIIFQMVTFETHDVRYCTCLPPTKYTSENTKKKKITDVFCLFLTSFCPSVLPCFKILLAHIVPARLLESRYVFPRLHEKSLHFCSVQNMSTFIRVPTNASYSSDFCLKVSLLDIQREVDTLFPLSVSHLQRVLCVWF